MNEMEHAVKTALTEFETQVKAEAQNGVAAVPLQST